jgi:chromosome segregation ATPase
MNQRVKDLEFKLKERDLEIKTLRQDMKEVERNEHECRTQMQNMAKEIDEREDVIEQLEIEVDN